jgi:hypothetical protein
MHGRLVYKIVIGAGNVQAQRNWYIWTTRGSDDGIVYEMLIEAVEKKGWTPEIHTAHQARLLAQTFYTPHTS